VGGRSIAEQTRCDRRHTVETGILSERMTTATWAAGPALLPELAIMLARRVGSTNT